jgi:hypothetical protein
VISQDCLSQPTQVAVMGKGIYYCRQRVKKDVGP